MNYPVRVRDARLSLELEKRFIAMLEALPDAIVIQNESGVIELVNHCAEEMFGFARIEMIGKPTSMLVPAHHLQMPVREHTELNGVRKDGSQFPVDLLLSPLKSENGLFVTTLIRDLSLTHARDAGNRQNLLSEKKSREIAENKSQVREELIAMVSHDLKNPLSSIILGAQLLDKGQYVSEAGKKLLVRIELSAARMLGMIQDLLDTHAIEKSPLGLCVEKKVWSVLSILKRAVDAQIMLAGQKSLSVDYGICIGDPVVWVDLERVQQVFQNLIGNAIKFTPAGGSIQLEAVQYDHEIIFSVSDNGPGISEQLVPHIFDRFSQDVATSKLGNGLGLSIAKSVVEAHGGRIWLESTLGQGSTFFFSIPKLQAS